MSEPLEIDHQATHRTLVERLKSETVPVRRLYSVRSRLILWLLLDTVLLLWIISHAARNYPARLIHPAYLSELLLFLAAAVMFAMLGLRSAIPGRTRRGAIVCVALVAVVGAIVAMAVANPPASSVTLGRFAAIGVNCAIGTVLWMSIPWHDIVVAVPSGCTDARCALRNLNRSGCSMLLRGGNAYHVPARRSRAFARMAYPAGARANQSFDVGWRSMAKP